MYTFNTRVRYSELDERGSLSIPSIINYFQDCSTFQSEALGVGLGYLSDSHKVWMLTHWQICIEQYPGLGDEIEIGTMAYDFDKLFGYRNFCINTNDGRRCVNGNSRWILYDIEKGRPARLTEEDTKAYGIHEKLQMNYTDEKIRVPKEYVKGESFPVRYYHLDTNGHVNNGKYVEMAMEYMNHERQIYELIVEYKQQAVLGNKVKPYITQDVVNDACTVTLVSEDETVVHAIIKFSYRKR